MKTSGLLTIGMLAALLFAPATYAQTASAVCKDGSTWIGKSHSGACRGHQGVQSWTDSSATTTSSTTTTTRKSRASRGDSSSGGMMTPSTTSKTTTGNATAICKDGSMWTGKSHSGACRGHQGVASWSSTSISTSTTAPTMPTSNMPSSRTNTMTTGSVSATCKDGTMWSGKSHSGACRGHQGVASWSSTSTSTTTSNAPMAPMPNRTSRTSTTTQTTTMRTTPAPGGGAGMVWVNASTKVYHCQGDRWYGMTKQGHYLTEAQAQAQGDRPDRGKQCH